MAEPRIKNVRLIKRVYRGRCSTIYKARNFKSGKVCAIKHVDREMDRSDKFFRHIRNEYRIGRAMLEEVGEDVLYPSIVKMYGLIVRRILLYVTEINIIMEFVPGDNLRDKKEYTLRETVDIYLQVAKALRYMHAHGYIHADMKDSNIIVCPDLSVKIVDFGLTCRRGEKISSIRGTRDFMAPEQITKGIIDERTDVYNLGATFYKVLAGRPLPPLMPGEGENGIFVMSDRMKPPSVSDQNPEVPAALNDIIMRSCERRREKRPESMSQVIGALESL